MHSESVESQLVMHVKVSSTHTSLQTPLSSKSLKKHHLTFLELKYECTYGQFGSTFWFHWSEQARRCKNKMKTLIWNIWSFWILFIELKGCSQRPWFSRANDAFIVKLNTSYRKVILFEQLLQTRIISFEFIARMYLYYRIFWSLLFLSIQASAERHGPVPERRFRTVWRN